MKIASNIIHEQLALIIVKNDLNFDLTSWNIAVRENPNWSKQGQIDKEHLVRCLEDIKNELKITREIILL